MKGDIALLLFELFYHVVRVHLLMALHVVKMVLSPIWMLKVMYCYAKSEIVDGIRHVFISKHGRQRILDDERKEHLRRRQDLPEEEVCYGKYLPQYIHKKFLRNDLVLVITDIVKSTNLWNFSPDAMYRTIETHDEIARRLCKNHGGYEIRNEGDSFFLIFVDIQNAVAFSVEFYLEIQRVSRSSGTYYTSSGEPWKLPLELRIAINKGPVVLRRDEFFGVHGNVVNDTYGMLDHSHSNSICVSGELEANITNFGKDVPFCVHK